MFCTNCGEKIGFKKICKKCGYKLDKGRKYCVYCGSRKDEKAYICTNCKQKKYETKFNFIKYILFGIFLLISVSFLFSYFDEKILGKLFDFIGFLLLAISFLPIWMNIIKAETINKKSLRLVFSSFKLICVPIILMAVIIYGAVNSSSSWTAEGASNYAIEAYFNTHLKNPDSLQIHNYEVTYSKETINNDITIWVNFDYSAQNGLGGYNRDNVVVTLLFNVKTGEYTYVSVKLEN